MKLTPKSQRDRRAMLLGVMLVVPALAYVWGVQPYRQTLDELRDRVGIEQSALARERALLAVSDQSDALRSAVNSVLDVYRPRLLDTGDHGVAGAELTEYVAKLAERNNVWLQEAYSRGTEIAPSGVRSHTIEIQTESDYAGIVRLLRAMEDGPKLLRIDRIHVGTSPADTSELTHVLAMRAMVTGFALGDPPAKPAKGRRTR